MLPSQRLSLLTQHLHSFSTSTTEPLLYSSHNHMLKVTLNRPSALNALSVPMLTSLRQHLPKLLQSHNFIWLEGNGGKSFCAGGDVKALFQPGISLSDQLHFFREEFTLDYELSQLHLPQIVNWDGIVMGGGYGISAFAKHRIATENSLWAMPECKIGFFTDVASSYVLSRLRNNIGYYLGMTGARLKGEELYITGVANHYIPRMNLQSLFEELSMLSSKHTLSGERGDKILDNELIEGVIKRYHQEPVRKTIENEEVIKELFEGGCAKSIYERVVKNAEKSEFIKGVKGLLEQQCPLSVAVVHRLIQRARKMDIRECFLQDYVLCGNFLIGRDFKEGVTCALIKKGTVPEWSHKSISEVSEEEIERFFVAKEGFVGLGI